MRKNLKDLSNLSGFNKFEGMFVPGKPSSDAKPLDVEQLIDHTHKKLKSQFNVTPRLAGSLPLKLNLPHDTDVDYFIPVQSTAKFEKLTKRLNNHPDFTTSKFNIPGANYHVYTRKADEHTPVPVDVAIATGPSAKAYVKTLNRKLQGASKLDASTRDALLHKKWILKHTPFDIKGTRYKAWKRDIDKALGGGVRLRREPLAKTAAILDLSDPQEQRKFLEYLQRSDVYGHRTKYIDSVLEEQRLYSALEALKRGKLKGYEKGLLVGSHENVIPQRLSQADVDLLSMELLKETPNTAIVKSVADKYNTDENTIKREFLKSRYGQIKAWLKGQKDPEQARIDTVSVPKLGPHIFVTRGGLLDTNGYGEYGVLLRSRIAKPSPFLNLINKEHTISPKGIMEPRSVALRNNYVIAPNVELARLNKLNPNLRYIGAENIPAHVRAKLMLPLLSLKEIPNRLIPLAFSGDLNVIPTR
jgi:hypothetical protein